MLTVLETKDHKLIAELTREAQELHVRLSPDVYKPFDRSGMEKLMAERVADSSYHFFIARKQGVAVACAVVQIRESRENAFHYTVNTLYIEQVCVLIKYQRAGAGKLLMESIEELARERSIKRIELDHWTDNIAAAGFFKKNGYVSSRQRLFKSVD